VSKKISNSKILQIKITVNIVNVTVTIGTVNIVMVTIVTVTNDAVNTITATSEILAKLK